MHGSNSSNLSLDYPFSVELLPKTAYMVGGAVRDALLCRDAKYESLYRIFGITQNHFYT